MDSPFKHSAFLAIGFAFLAATIVVADDSSCGKFCVAKLIGKYDQNDDGKLNADECPEKFRDSFGQELVQFISDDAEQRWYTVNDGVMGGLSEGSVRLTGDKKMEFFGELSLENNGGFASVRSARKKLRLEEGDTVVVRVRGDGRQYYLNLYVPTRRIAFSYRAPIQTKDGEWIEVRVPLSDFYATSFGRRVRNAQLKPSQVNSVGFLLADKTAGPFRLEVDSIRVAKPSN